MTFRALPLLLVVTACASAGKPASSPTPSPGGGLPRQVQAAIRTDHGPSELLVGTAFLYVGAHRGGTIQRIDPATNRVTGTVAVGGQLELENSTSLGGLAAIDEGTTSLWACSNTDGVLHQVDPRSLRVTAGLSADCDGGTRTRVGDTLWAAPGAGRKPILVVHVRTGKVVRRIAIGDAGPGWGAAVSAGGHVVLGSHLATPVLTTGGRVLRRSATRTPWIVGTGGRLYRLPLDGTVAELDPATLTVVRTFRASAHVVEDGDPRLVADDAGHLYYRPTSTAVFRIDLADGAVTPLLDLPHGQAVTGMAWAFDSLWVTNFDDDTVWRINPAA
jgi:DNA-binding beta-propeller fold protein YncE